MEDCNDTLKTLKIYSIYESFNKPKLVDGNNVECEQLKHKLPHYPVFNSLCYKLSRNLKDVCIYLMNSTKNTESCIYLNYWLYDLLIKNNLLDNLDNISASEIVQKLPDLWRETNYNGKCDLTQYDISASDFNFMKILHDYSFNYLTIDEIKDNITDGECKRHYCTYINRVIHFYTTAESHCADTPQGTYCEIFKTVAGEKNPNKLFTTLKCTKNDLDDKLLQIPKNYENEFLSFLPPSTDYILSDWPIFETTPNVGAKIGFSLFAISIISLFLLYKFTPMGSILCTIIRSKLNSSSFLREKLKLQLLKHNEVFEDEKSHNNEHNISYLSLGNG
ncbi:PIR protein [Plasmodium ovale]|uniref:PIR protein n=1 Tax=Plasmodium ovale TaxID=36330 RepID=A0A1D3JDB0_PLAOA|nr:PIR protein [Plasmodium ovale]